VCKGEGDHAAALDMLHEAQARTEEMDDPHLHAKLKINLAVCLIELERPEEAAAILLETFAVCSQYQLFDYLAESNLYLGKIALAKSELESALGYLDAGLVAARQVNFRWCEAHLFATRAQVFSLRGNFEMAMQTVKEAQAIAIADGFSDMLIQQHYDAAEYAAALKDFASAFLEYKAGHACEQRLYGRSPGERKLAMANPGGGGD
jgi:tetratricopeptide (TPR) repeat protein